MDIIKYNKYLLSSDMKDPEKANEAFTWARTGEGPKMFRLLAQSFAIKLKMVKEQSLLAKQEAKKKKAEKLIEIIDECRQHGGPLTSSTADRLDSLTTDQVRSECRYLKATTAPDITLKKRVPADPGTGKKFKMVDVDENVLRGQLRCHICPFNGSVNFAEAKRKLHF